LKAERAFAQTLGGSCHSPIAAHASLEGESLVVHGFVGAPDGQEVYRDVERGAPADTEALGRRLAARMQAAGAGALLERLRDEAAAGS
jgi:hydroxymethylbilane synthase